MSQVHGMQTEIFSTRNIVEKLRQYMEHKQVGIGTWKDSEMGGGWARDEATWLDCR